MEPRIATLLDQQPYRRLMLDPSVLTTPSSGAPRYIEPAPGVRAGYSYPDTLSYHDHVDARHKASSQAHSGAPLARVLNDPASSSPAFPHSGRATPQNATSQARSDVPVTAISSDTPRREDQPHTSGYTGGDGSLIQLPKPPQAPRRTTKRPRIPPLLQGLHQPPPLPPKNKLFPPISERSGPGNEVGDHFGLTSTFSGSTEKRAKARAAPEKSHQPAIADAEHSDNLPDTLRGSREQETSCDSTPGPSPVFQTTDRVQAKAKTTRKRTKWSEKETEDLLIGVSRYGIGRWKQILECADFTFQGRTAVDLKDRFRVCRPGEGLKARKGATKQVSKPGSADTATLSAEAVSAEPSVAAHQASPEDSVTNGAAELRPEDDYGPFPKSNRRARRQFSDEDDRNLLRGFNRYGTRWRAMRDDFELGFSMRHPTDLRDRFRIRFPGEFAKAGFKLKPKEARELGEAEEAKAQKKPVSRPPSPTGARASVTTAPIATLAPAPAPTSTRPTLDLVTDFTFDDDEDGSERSPIVLNRNILQWADENSTSTAPPSTPLPTLPSSDFLYNPFAPTTDGLHINPLATLKLSSTAHWSYMNPSLPRPAPSKHVASANQGGVSGRAQQEMRAPNLPNIVFPYVPSASARGAVHNLPAPADILSERGDGGWEG